MRIEFSEGKIELEKELTSLDRFVIDFTLILNNLNIKYVIVSGYIPILFGRNRASEDIDMLIEKIDFGKFENFWKNMLNKFECLNVEDINDAYRNYLLQGSSIRISKKGEFVPNMEIKLLKDNLDLWTLKWRRKVSLNKNIIFISPMELQIPFKLFLGSEKDIEDAKYLYSLFKDKIDIKLLLKFNRKLKIESLFNKYLK